MSETNVPLQQQKMLESSNSKYPSAEGIDIYSKITSRIKVSISETFFDSQILIVRDQILIVRFFTLN